MERQLFNLSKKYNEGVLCRNSAFLHLGFYRNSRKMLVRPHKEIDLMERHEIIIVIAYYIIGPSVDLGNSHVVRHSPTLDPKYDSFVFGASIGDSRCCRPIQCTNLKFFGNTESSKVTAAKEIVEHLAFSLVSVECEVIANHAKYYHGEKSTCKCILGDSRDAGATGFGIGHCVYRKDRSVRLRMYFYDLIER
jgi:hypothetical protein